MLGIWSSSSHSRWQWGLLEVAISQEHWSLRAAEFSYKAGFGHRTWSRGSSPAYCCFSTLETLFCSHYALSIWQSGLETLCFHLASGAGEQLFSTEGRAFWLLHLELLILSMNRGLFGDLGSGSWPPALTPWVWHPQTIQQALLF